MKRTRFRFVSSVLASAVFSATFAFAYPPADGSGGGGLLEQVHEAASVGHHALTYTDARHAMFSFTDNTEWEGRRGVLEAYSEIFVEGRSPEGGDYPERGDQNQDGVVDSAGMNTEHVWPQSFFDRHLPMRSDLHHLLPTFNSINSIRDRNPFGPSAGPYRNTAGARCCDNGFEPPDSAKGRVARAMFYFYTRYQGEGILPEDFIEPFWNSRIEIFLAWNRAFPPTEFEAERNRRVQEVQGNRNPFVDDPGLADRIGVAGFWMGGGRFADAGGRVLASYSLALDYPSAVFAGL